MESADRILNSHVKEIDNVMKGILDQKAACLLI